jgi:hypothetical protein
VLHGVVARTNRGVLMPNDIIGELALDPNIKPCYQSTHLVMGAFVPPPPPPPPYPSALLPRASVRASSVRAWLPRC